MDNDVWQTIADEWGKAGMSPHGIAGVLANVREESNFNPTLRHPDQPNWGGEAHFAHGLYQEGGEEWNNYSNWLNQNYPGKNWQDPRLQSEFAAWNLKNNYPKVWDAMNGATSPIQAGASYASGYLKPAAQYLNSRIAGFQRNGIPTLDDYTNGTANYRPSTPQLTAPAYASASPPTLPGAASPPTSAAEPAPQPAAASGFGSPLSNLSNQLLSQGEEQPAPQQPMQMMPSPQARLRNVLMKMAQQQQTFPNPVAQRLIDVIQSVS